MVLDDDELSILLGFHLELALTELLDAAELTRYIPPSRPYGLCRGRGARACGTGRGPARPRRPVCLLTLIDPTPAEADALAMSDLLGLLSA